MGSFIRNRTPHWAGPPVGAIPEVVPAGVPLTSVRLSVRSNTSDLQAQTDAVSDTTATLNSDSLGASPIYGAESFIFDALENCVAASDLRYRTSLFAMPFTPFRRTRQPIARVPDEIVLGDLATLAHLQSAG